MVPPDCQKSVYFLRKTIDFQDCALHALMPREVTGGHGRPREAAGGHGCARSPRTPRDFCYAILEGAPGGDPPPATNLYICGGYCLDCIRLRMPPLLFLSSISSVAFLKQTCSLLFLAYCFSCTFLASRSMIAQVFVFVVKPMENHTFWHQQGSQI